MKLWPFFIFFLIVLSAMPVARAADAITANGGSVVRTLPLDMYGFTGNDYPTAAGSRSDSDGDGCKSTGGACGETLGSGFNLTNYTLARQSQVTLYTDSEGNVNFAFRNDLNHEYCMANNASENGHCNQANPQSIANMKTMYDWMDTLNGTVSVTLAMLHSRYDDGDISKPCDPNGLNCPPDSYSYRASTLISTMKLAGICPTWCTGDPTRPLTISQWNEPYNVQYWLDNLSNRLNSGAGGYSGNCTLATVEFNNFIERDFAAMETARVREGYTWYWATPSWPSRTSAASFNDCGVDMQDDFNDRFSPNTNGSLDWDVYEAHPYSRNDANGVYTLNPAYYREIAAYARSYGYDYGIATETAENGKTSGYDTGGGSAFAANDTYLNNSYVATVVAAIQDDFWVKLNFFTYWHDYDCSNIDAGSGVEFDRCYYMFSEREGERGAYDAYQGIIDCAEGGSVIYTTTNTSGVGASLNKLQNGTYCLMTHYAKATGTSAVNVTFTNLNVTQMVNIQNGSIYTVTSNFANLGTYGPGTIGLYYLDATDSGPGPDPPTSGLPVFLNGLVAFLNGRVLFG